MRFLMTPWFKQNAAALNPLDSRNIVDPTQLIGYDTD